VLAAVAGASMWISLGTLALTDDQGSRLGALPPPWLAAVLIALAAAIAWLVRLRASDGWPLALTVTLWLPWLPLPVPAAFFIWEGLLESLVWAAALAGVVFARMPPRAVHAAALISKPHIAPWTAASLAFVCSIAAWTALHDRLPDGDEPHYLIMTQSLIHDGDLQIENNHNRGDYLDYYTNGLPPDYLRRGSDEQIYSIHAPGLSALVLPAFVVAGYAAVVIFLILVCAAGVALMWRAVYVLTGQVGASWMAVLGVGSSAPFFLHSFSIFPDPVGAAIVAAAVALLIELDTTDVAAGESSTATQSMARVRVIAVGGALAFLPWLHTRFALIAGAAGLCIALRLLSRPSRWSNVAWFGVVPVVSAAGWLLFFWVIYGTVDPRAPYGGSRQNAIAWMANGATGLAFDQQFGLLTNAPVMVLAIVGFVVLGRTRPRLAVELLAIGVPYAAVVTSFAMWWGGWSAPARFLVAILPLTAPALAVAWRNGGTAVRSIFAALLLVGIANVIARVVTFDGALLYNTRDGYDLLVDWLSRSVNLPLALPAVHRTGVPGALRVAGVWILAGTAAVITLFLIFKRWTIGPGGHWTITGVVLLIAVVVAVTASWRVEQAVTVTAESSKVEFVRRWQPSLHPVVVDMPRLEFLNGEAAFRNLTLRTSRRRPPPEREPRLLDIERLPAGTYSLVAEGSASTGRVTVFVNSAVPLEQWTLGAFTGAETGIVMHLPIDMQSLVIRGDDAATSRAVRLALRPAVIGSRSRVHGLAERAARYGRVRTFLLDDGIYVEPSGMWTRGNTDADLVLSADSSGWADTDLQAGPTPTVVDLHAGEWSHRVELAPGARVRTRIPAGPVVTIRTTGAFRPVDHDASARDARPLGVRIEFPVQ
jgi:hypothetical protein